MIRTENLRAMKYGEKIVFIRNSDEDTQNMMNTISSNNTFNNGKFKQRMVLIVDKNFMTVHDGLLVECVEECPGRKERSKVKKIHS